MSGWFSPFVFHSAVQAITPILLAALAGALSTRAGVFNLALEGQMLIGAFFAVVGSHISGSATIGVAAAIVAATIFSGILASGATVLRGDAVVVGIAMNLLASSLTAFLLRAWFGTGGTFADPDLMGLATIGADMIGVPVIGWSFANQTLPTYVVWPLTALIALVVAKTPLGLRLRAVGEKPEAARTLGLKVDSYRAGAVLCGGALCGLAGAQLSLGAVSVFAEDMSAGRGWIAVVAVMLGRADPLRSAAACIIFGFADAFGVRLQALGLPNQLTDVAPYVVTLAALIAERARRQS